jgi:hypothetical protein
MYIPTPHDVTEYYNDHEDKLQPPKGFYHCEWHGFQIDPKNPLKIVYYCHLNCAEGYILQRSTERKTVQPKQPPIQKPTIVNSTSYSDSSDSDKSEFETVTTEVLANLRRNLLETRRRKKERKFLLETQQHAAKVSKIDSPERGDAITNLISEIEWLEKSCKFLCTQIGKLVNCLAA